MNTEILRELLQKDEYGALDFKRKPHSIFNDDKILAEQNQHELIRDVVSLANAITNYFNPQSRLFSVALAFLALEKLT